MKKTILFLLLMVTCDSFSQDEHYRFQFSVAEQSILNWGFRSFEDVSTPSNNYQQVYQSENFKVDYKNFTLSGGLNAKFSWFWWNRENLR